MNKIIIDGNTLKTISLFERLTRAKLKDCIISDEKVTFIVEENEIGKAIGKKGVNIKKLENLLKKKIIITEFSSDPVQFIRNILYRYNILDIRNEEGIVSVQCPDTKTRGLVIGRNKQNLNRLISIVRRYFDIKEIKII